MSRAALAALVVLAALAPVARAEPPSSAELAWGRQVANHYWGRLPTCGEPKIVLVSLGPSRAAEARNGECTIAFNTDEAWNPWTTCLAFVHEDGHLILGEAFAAVNPSDPWHSPDSTNVMYGGTRNDLAREEAVIRNVGCVHPTSRIATRSSNWRRRLRRPRLHTSSSAQRDK